uniref:Uncharacterized protein n=1 Tax=Medicago truncatula TaxID=3880 RepID=A2Q2W1_MEDTR|nr:hypothetical protein MtrDRAFT_AC152185g1v2 [Medicago truncatula]
MFNLRQGKIMSSRHGEVIDPWDKFKFVISYSINFLPWVKRFFLGYKKTRFKFSPRVDDVFSP